MVGITYTISKHNQVCKLSGGGGGGEVKASVDGKHTL